jgi:hypothetical protein
MTVAGPYIRAKMGEILPPHAGIVKTIIMVLDPSSSVG